MLILVCTALAACSLRTQIVHLQLRIHKLIHNPRAFDVPSDPGEERAARDIVQVSQCRGEIVNSCSRAVSIAGTLLQWLSLQLCEECKHCKQLVYVC
jgi:hypothetical protein